MSKRTDYKVACQTASEQISSVVPRDVVEALMQAADAYIEELEEKLDWMVKRWGGAP